MARVGRVAACDHERGHLAELELRDRLEGRRARHLAKGPGDRIRVAVLEHPLASEAQNRLSPGRVQPFVVGLHEPLHPIALQPVGEPVPARQRLLVDESHVDGPDEHQASEPLYPREREGGGRVGAHGVAREHHRLVTHLGVEHRLQIGRQLGVGVAAVRRRGVKAPTFSVIFPQSA